jgi:calcineurin-like phosphoesterase family protein
VSAEIFSSPLTLINFGHFNIIKYCERPFDSAQMHDRTLIENWNTVVAPGDTVYHLGDFGLAKKGYLIQILKQLNGTIKFIRGNHDKSMKGDALYYVEELGIYHELNIDDKEMKVKQGIILCHYPFQTWNRSHWGTWHLHGHCHGNLKSPDTMARLDVGVDSHDFMPITYEEVKFIMTRKGLKPPKRTGLIPSNQLNHS